MRKLVVEKPSLLKPSIKIDFLGYNKYIVKIISLSSSRSPLSIFSTIILILLFSQASAQIEFVENKGQWGKNIQFQTRAGAGAFFIEDNGFTVLMHNDDDVKAIGSVMHGHSIKELAKSGTAVAAKILPVDEKLIMRSHAYKVKFEGANFSKGIPDKQLQGVNNYFIGNDPSVWASDCKLYKGITYKDVYPKIDLRYYSDGAGRLKYDLIVHPGANPSAIAMRYDGVNKLSVKNKELLIGTSVGEVKELYPYSYQVVEAKRKEVDVRYDIKGNLVRFNITGYDPTTTLVIDPTVVFASFTGSTADNWGFTATYGADGSFYAGGIAFANGYPVSTGAFQTVFGGGMAEGSNSTGYDIAIIKLTSNGSNRVYATYIGGSKNEQPHSMIVDPTGNLIIAGRTISSNYPAVTNFGVRGDWDIVVTKLNSTGSALIGSVKIGGKDADGVNIRPKSSTPTQNEVLLTRRNYGDDARSEIILDAAGNIYVASCSRSDDFPTPGGVQTTFGGGNQDGVLLKFNPNLSSLIFSTYLGGNGVDACFVLAIEPNTNNIFVAGATGSPDFPGTQPGVYQQGYQGGQCDGFVATFNNSGTALIRSSYVGTSGHDLVYGIQFDKLGFPYIMGTTTGSWPVLNAAYSVPNSKQFISKLQPDLSQFIYSTVFGTGSLQPNISPVAFLVDRCENVYVSGWGGGINVDQGYSTGNTVGMPTTADAIKPNSDAKGAEMYFFVLEKNATKILYGTFFGQNDNPGIQSTGEHVDGGTSRFDQNGIIYQAICANCIGHPQRYPTTAGAWAETNGSSVCNELALKIEMDFTGVAGSIRSTIDGVDYDSSGCIDLTVQFSDTLLKAKSYLWLFGDGSPQVRTTVPTISHTYTQTGIYTVRLISVDSTTCNIQDTVYATIKAGNNPVSPDFLPRKLGSCNSLTFSFQNLSTATVPTFGTQSFLWDFGDGSPKIRMGKDSIVHTFASAGTYRVTLRVDDTTFCNSPKDTIKTLRISPNVSARFVTPPFGCVPYNAAFTNNSLGGLNFLWDFGDGSTSTLDNPTHFYPIAGTYLVTLIAYDSTSCNLTDTVRFSLTVSPIPQAGFTFSPTVPVENSFTQFNNTSIGASSFLWNFGDGDSTKEVNPRHLFNATGNWNVCLQAMNQAGCIDTFCLPVPAIINPLLDVPNAFTPGKFGVNSVVKVIGFGIKEMQWRIYNRWGQKIFETNDRSIGWDGTFNGKLQPLDVYTYTLDVKFSDGKTFRKTGDITLLK